MAARAQTSKAKGSTGKAKKPAAKRPAKAPAPIIWPRWRDAEMTTRIANRLRRGWSEAAVSLAEGLADRTVAVWLSRWRKAVDRADEEAEAGGVPEQTDFIRAVTPLARALGEFFGEMEERASEDGPDGHGQGARWYLPRRLQAVWGSGLDKALDPSAPKPISPEETRGLLMAAVAQAATEGDG